MTLAGLDTPLDILTRVFGYHAFRGRQAAIIDHVVGGGDALVIMPTRCSEVTEVDEAP